MKKGAILFVAMVILGVQVANAQAPASPDSASTHTQMTQTTQTTQTTQPAPAPAPPPPAMASPTQKAYRFGSISGSWLMPSGDFDKVAGDGWAITLEGYQYMSPAKKIAVGSQVAYQSFGKKNGVTVQNFPVDAVLKFFPKPGVGKIDLYGTGGLGFNYQRTDVGHSSSSDYFFGTQAGVGAVMHGKGAAGLIVDAVYHWVFSNGTGSNFVALRAGLLVPMMR